MPAISLQSLGAAAITRRGLGVRQRENLADEVQASQPQPFHSILALQWYGSTLIQIESFSICW